MTHVFQVQARCDRCGCLCSQPLATQAAATARALKLSWTVIDLPFGVRLLLCAFCSRFASRKEILQEIARAAAAQAEAEQPPPACPPAIPPAPPTPEATP